MKWLRAACFFIMTSSSLSFQVFILRHGQTDANANEVEQGSADFSRLTDLGKQQARDAFQAFIPTEGEEDNNVITSIYSSPLTRARATLQELRGEDEKSSARILPPEEIVLENLREIDLYDWQGQEYEVLEKNFPDSWNAWKEGNPNELVVLETQPDGGTDPIERYPLLEVWERADRVWDEIFLQEQQKLENEDDEGISRVALVVAHGNLGQALHGTAMGWDANQFREHEFPNCGMLELDFASYKYRPQSAHRWRWKWPRSTEGGTW